MLDKTLLFHDIAAPRGGLSLSISRRRHGKDQKRYQPLSVSSENTGFFYVTKKNPRNTKKLELKKYDPVARKHVVFKEGKIKEAKK